MVTAVTGLAQPQGNQKMMNVVSTTGTTQTQEVQSTSGVASVPDTSLAHLQPSSSHIWNGVIAGMNGAKVLSTSAYAGGLISGSSPLLSVAGFLGSFGIGLAFLGGLSKIIGAAGAKNEPDHLRIKTAVDGVTDFGMMAASIASSANPMLGLGIFAVAGIAKLVNYFRP